MTASPTLLSTVAVEGYGLRVTLLSGVEHWSINSESNDNRVILSLLHLRTFLLHITVMCLGTGIRTVCRERMPWTFAAVLCLCHHGVAAQSAEILNTCFIKRPAGDLTCPINQSC